MVAQIIAELGPWTWMLVGLLLLVGEALIPGVFLIWFGLAGVAVGAVTLVFFADTQWWSWQVQLVLFGVLSLIFVIAGNRLFPASKEDDAANHLNDPLARHLGVETELVEAINNGSGRVKLGDTTWRVLGPKLAVGKRVRVVGVENGALLVEAL